MDAGAGGTAEGGRQTMTRESKVTGMCRATHTAWCLAFAAAYGVAAAGQAPPATDFSAEVRARFDSWDQDHDGLLSHAETEAAIADSRVTGRSAAALAAIQT